VAASRLERHRILRLAVDERAERIFLVRRDAEFCDDDEHRRVLLL
jgi:hypothetical protein